MTTASRYQQLQGVAHRRCVNRLQLGHQLSGRFLARIVLATIGMILLAAAGSSAAVLAGAALVITLGEYHERRLFFLASVAPRMPGSPR